MKRIFFFVFTFFAMLSLEAGAAGRLAVEMRYPMDAAGRRSDSGKGVLEVLLRNLGDRPVSINARRVPFTNRDGLLTESMFRVVDADKREARYRGVFVSYADGVEPSYLELAPKQAKIYSFNISLSYAVEPGGTYEVSLSSPIRYLPDSRNKYGNGVSAADASFREVAGGAPLKIRIDP